MAKMKKRSGKKEGKRVTERDRERDSGGWEGRPTCKGSSSLSFSSCCCCCCASFLRVSLEGTMQPAMREAEQHLWRPYRRKTKRRGRKGGWRMEVVGEGGSLGVSGRMGLKVWRSGFIACRVCVAPRPADRTCRQRGKKGN